MLRFISRSPAETRAFAEKFGSLLRVGDTVAFTGNLGAGKTEFTKGIAKALGYPGNAYSPTFAIVNSYDAGIPIYHFDMYRIQGYDALYSTGFFDFCDGSAVIIIEWSENITDFLPENTVFVEMEYGDDEFSRIITVKGDERFEGIGD